MAATATPSLARSRSHIPVDGADTPFRKRVIGNVVRGDALSEEAVGGAHVVSKLLECPCDGVSLDRNLPDLDALEVAELVRTQYPHLTVELVDSRDDVTPSPSLCSGALSSGPRDFVSSNPAQNHGLSWSWK